MASIPLSNSDVLATVDDSDYERVAQFRWSLEKGYAYTYIDRRKVRMHQLLFECEPGMLTDHRNRDKLDNRRSNFRPATPLQNSVNNGLRKDNRSGFKGVTWNKQVGRWKAQIRAAGKRLFLGYFHDATAAARAYDAKAKELFGEFAFLNLAD